jgi:tRNA (guanine37-N1)-methyltransferase
LRKRLRERLGHTDVAGDMVGAYNSFDIVGDVAITRVPRGSYTSATGIAETIMRRHRNVRAVFTQTSAVQGDYRLRRLTYAAGEDRTLTLHRESSCLFTVDVDKCYFSPRLSGERQRIAKLVAPGEVVVNMFAGVGCFSILIAKVVRSVKVYSIDINPNAVHFMEDNVRLNRVYGKVVPLLGDAKAIVESRLQGCADRVLMPLPEKALKYLPAAVLALKPSGGWLHVHFFEHAEKNEDPAEKIMPKLGQALNAQGRVYDIPNVRVVRNTGPNWWQLVADVRVYV